MITTLQRFRRGALALSLGWALAAGAQSAPAGTCPPQAQAPTQEQMQAAQRAARDRGALWKITRDGNTSYLFGTIHIGKLEWVMPGPRMRSALGATDTIALEIDPTDPQVMSRMSEAIGGGKARALPEPLAQRMSRRVDAACLPEQARPVIEAQHPVMRAVTLSVLEARWEGLDAGYAQEFALAGFGRAAQRRLVSLETPESQIEALIPKDAAEVEKVVSSTLDQLDKGVTRRTVSRLAAAWERGDLAEMEQYERWCECMLDDTDRGMLKRLLDDRNPALAEGIDKLHKEGRKVFAAVGILHMVGPMGLPSLLKARGFAVERVAFQ